MTYFIKDSETGSMIEQFDTRQEAECAMSEYEADDKTSGNYTPDFYQITEAYEKKDLLSKFKQKTQQWSIIEYLLMYGSILNYEFNQELFILSHSRRIKDIRNVIQPLGFDIKIDPVEDPNRSGTRKYTIIERG